MTESPSPEREDERGAALVLVLIVSVGLVGMLAFLIPKSQANIKSQSLTRELVDMQLLLRAGVAEAMNEISEGIDPLVADDTDDGVGAVGTGVQEFWSSGGTGYSSSFDRTNLAHLSRLGKELLAGSRSMGRYAAWITRPVAGEYRLHVVVVYPNFVTPRQLAGAEIRVAEPSGGRNAVSLSGPFTSGGGNFGVQFPSDVTIDIDGGAYPAFNVSEAGMFTGADMPGGFTQFVDDILVNGSIAGSSTGEGAGKGSPPWSGNAGEDWDTTENVSEADLRLSNAVIDQVANDFLDIVNAAIANSEQRLWADDGGSHNKWQLDNITGSSQPGGPVNLNSLVGTHSSPPDPGTEKVWRIGAMSNKSYEFIGRDIQGSGALVLNGGNEIEFKGGTTMVWNGDVFLIGTKNQHLDLEDADLTINGNLYMIMDPAASNKTLKLHIEDNASRLTVNGSVVLVASGNNKIDFHVDKAAAQVVVNGVFLALGNNVSLQVEGKDASNVAKFEVYGSLIAGVPAGGGITEFEFTKHVQAKLEYHDANYEAAMSEFGAVTDALKRFASAGYLEVSGATKLDELYRALTNADGTAANNVLDDPTWTLDPTNTTVDARLGM